MPAAEKPTVSGAPLRGSSVRPPLTTLRAHAASAPMSGMAARPPRNVRLRMSFPSGPARRFSAALTMCLFLNVAESHFKPSSLELSKPPRFQEIAQTACERFGLLRMLRSTPSVDPTLRRLGEVCTKSGDSMTRAEQTRLWARRVRVLREATAESRNATAWAGLRGHKIHYPAELIR